MRAAALVFTLLAAATASPRAQVACQADGAKKVTAALALFASIPDDRDDTPELTRLRGELLQEYVARFAEPHQMTVLQSSAERTVRLAGSIFEPGLVPIGEIRFTVSVAGRATDARLTQATSDPAFDSALLRGVASMDSAHVSFFAPPGRDTLQLRIQLGVNPSAGAYPTRLVTLAPLGTITRPAHILPTDVFLNVPISYWKKRIEDEIVVQLLVDERGRAVMDSVRVVQGKDQVYIHAVLAAIRKYRWSPAQAGDCTVKQWVQMPFRFHFAPAK